MTRPENRLYAFNHFSKGNFGELVHAALQKIADPSNIDMMPLIYEQGDESEKKEYKEPKEDEFYCPTEHHDRLWYPDIVLRANHDEAFSSDEILYGNCFHLLMAQVNKLDELDETLSKLIANEEINGIYEERLVREAKGLLSNSIYKNFIENSTDIRSETTIIVGPKEVKRPDKIIFLSDKIIIIDFKTGAKQSKHIDQAITYQGIMNEMFELPTETYLYYSASCELIIC
jgi:hypothetical protein